MPGPITRTTRNRQPRQIDRMNLHGGATNFLQRVIACLVLADGEFEFRRKALERSAEVNAELGTTFGIRECGTLQGATEIALLWLKARGRMVTQFAPSDAARIWHGGRHGNLDRGTIPFWQHCQRFFASPKSTSELIRMAEELT